MLARAIATVDHIAQGRLAINIISSDLPGLKESNWKSNLRPQAENSTGHAWGISRLANKRSRSRLQPQANTSRRYTQDGQVCSIPCGAKKLPELKAEEKQAPFPEMQISAILPHDEREKGKAESRSQ